MLHAQLCLILCDPTNSSPPVFSVHGILQARTLEWIAIPFSRVYMGYLITTCESVMISIQISIRKQKRVVDCWLPYLSISPPIHLVSAKLCLQRFHGGSSKIFFFKQQKTKKIRFVVIRYGILEEGWSKGTNEDKVIREHHWLSGNESEQTLGDEDRGAWCAAVRGVTNSQTWLSNWTATTLMDVVYGMILWLALLYDIHESCWENRSTEFSSQRQSFLKKFCIISIWGNGY